MKLINVMLAALLVCGVARAAQDVTLDKFGGDREVRDPKLLKAWLEANASDAETRIAALEGGSTVGTVLPQYIIVGNASSQGVDVAVSGDIGISSAGVVTIANDAVSAAKIGTITQSNTNVTTTATGYTPAYVGQVLVGRAGTGTNAVWISKGVTTNDWVRVAP